MSILEKIFSHKREEVSRQMAEKPLDTQLENAARAAPPLDFVSAVRRRRLEAAPEALLPHGGSARRMPALIAEIKRASPSRGLLAPTLDAAALASLYAANGAAAVSVLTDETFFHGSLGDLRQVRSRLPDMPLLCKDFIFHPYQLVQARAAGADAVLLIVAGLAFSELQALHTQALALGLTPLVEVHDRGELHSALACQPILVGINNRNLHDFSMHLETSLELRAEVPPGVCVVAESGIHSRADVERLAYAGVDAILVGEALVTAADIPAQVRALAGLEAGKQADGEAGRQRAQR